jgi:uncharacterized membrane protein
MRIVSLGHAVFALTMIALGIVGLYKGNFVPVWEPVPADVPARELLVYGSAIISLACGAGLLVRKTAPHAARVLFVTLAVWLIAFRVRTIIRAPGEFGAWDGCAETAVIVSAARVLCGGRRFSRILFALALVSFGLAHFIYPAETAVLVPSYLPAHIIWAYATGIAFCAAAAAVLSGIRARLAAMLATAQMGLFTVLVWVPMIARGGANAFQWSELGISAALTAAAWVIADSFASGSASR